MLGSDLHRLIATELASLDDVALGRPLSKVVDRQGHSVRLDRGRLPSGHQVVAR